MGRMKDLYIDQRNQEQHSPDDTDWNVPPKYDGAGFTEEDNQLTPPPDQINLDNGKSMWVIKGYKIWAQSYAEALQLLPMIENF